MLMCMETYVNVRNIVIDFVRSNPDIAYDYSNFNRYWNDTLRCKFGFPENYLTCYEFDTLCDLAQANKQYSLTLYQQAYYSIFPPKIESWSSHADDWPACSIAIDFLASSLVAAIDMITDINR